MTTANVKALVAYRFEQADESLEAARILLDQGLTRPSMNRYQRTSSLDMRIPRFEKTLFKKSQWFSV